ncbi:MAG: tetratricopeptide repeat protein [Bacteroidota bacterium]
MKIKEIIRTGLITLFFLSVWINAGCQENNPDPDTLFAYGMNYLRKDNSLANEYALKLYSFSRRNKNPGHYGKSLYLLGRINQEMGKTKEALAYYDSSVIIMKKTGNEEYLANSYQSLGNLYDDIGDNKKCMENYIRASEIYERINNFQGIANISNNIGLTYAQLGEYGEALKYFIKSYDAHKEIENHYGMGNTCNNIGLVYANTGVHDTAEYWMKMAMSEWEIIGDLRGQAMTLNGLGRLMLMKENIPLAIEYYNKSVEICEGLNDQYGLCQNLICIGELYEMTGYYNTALQYYLDAIRISDIMGSTRKKAAIYEKLSSLYYKDGDFKNAADAMKTYNILKDSIITEENMALIADMREKYESEKKEKEILEKDVEIAQKEKENQRQRYFRNILIAGFLGLIVMLIFIYRSYRIKRKSNRIISEKNQLLEMANSEISAQRDEIEAQRDLVVQQRDLILEQKQDITDSIEYAYRIQSAIFPDPDDIRLILKDFFIFYRPRDIVSGDFYWINKKGKKIIIIAADCTGHGVPGAFMSMLGIAFLNEIVNKENITSPEAILNRLRENIIIALKQHGKTAEQRDGMDVAAIAIDTAGNRLEFCGANNPLYLIKNDDLLEIKGDKMPVSVYYKMIPFAVQEIEILTGDIIYLFSDGFPDQFGGPQGKKFKYKPFKDLLRNISSEPMFEQKRILEYTFGRWMKSESYQYEQIDDVLVMGIKI